MTERLRALLAEATPGPWIRPWGTHKIHQSFGRGCDDIGLPDRDIDLITGAVNALPDLLDVVDAAQKARAAWRLVNYVAYHGDEDELLADGLTLDDPMDSLRDALARLEDPS